MAKTDNKPAPARKTQSAFVRIVKQVKKAAIDDKISTDELDKISSLAASLKGMILSD